MKKILTSNKTASAIGPYVKGIEINDILYISGQIPVNKNGKIISSDIKNQTIQAMENLKNLLEDNKSSCNKIIKTTCYLKNMDDFKIFNEEYAKYFNKDNYPSRVCVEVSKLPLDVLIELDAIAHK